MQQKLPQDERYEQRPDGTIRRFPQQPPAPQSAYIPQPPQPVPPKPPRREKWTRRRRIWLYVFALIGMAFVAVEIFRYLIVPLLVQVHIWTGGRL